MYRRGGSATFTWKVGSKNCNRIPMRWPMPIGLGPWAWPRGPGPWPRPTGPDPWAQPMARPMGLAHGPMVFLKNVEKLMKLVENHRKSMEMGQDPSGRAQ